MIIREDEIHLAIRDYLIDEKWRLLAGQYPDGSDDHLPKFYIRNPDLARDNSPDPRRHSQGTLQIDLLAVKSKILLLIEIKPKYSKSDELKLLKILGERREDFYNSFYKTFKFSVNDFHLLPVLGFSDNCKYHSLCNFSYFLVKNRNELSVRGPIDEWNR